MSKQGSKRSSRLTNHERAASDEVRAEESAGSSKQQRAKTDKALKAAGAKPLSKAEKEKIAHEAGAEEPEPPKPTRSSYPPELKAAAKQQP